MKIYSFDEKNQELFKNTLRESDYLDACTPSIPSNSVVADKPLPVLKAHQALIVTGLRNADGYFTVSQNIEIIDDFRGTAVFDKKTGEQLTHHELGTLPDAVTTIPPIPYSKWSESKNAWVELDNADELRLLDRRAAAGTLTRNQILTEIEIRRDENKEKLLEIAERELEGIHLIKVRNAINEAVEFTLINDDIWQFFTETLGIEIDTLFEFWEEAKKNY